MRFHNVFRRRHSRQAAIGLSVLILLSLCVIGLSPTVVLAGNPSGFGNGNFNGISSTVPDGYIEPPAAYNSGETLTYNFVLTNTTQEPVMFNLVWNVTRILKLGNLDLSDGTADVAGTTFKENWQQANPQVLVYSEPRVISLAPGETQQYSFTWQTSECGYFQLDLGRNTQSGFETVNSGYVRVGNCQEGGAQVIVTNPPAKVQAEVAPQAGLLPVTGSLDGFARNLLIGVLIAGALLAFGACIRLRLSR